MTLSLKLQEYFSQFPNAEIYKRCRALFNPVYTKTCGDKGCYFFYSKTGSDSFIDDYQDQSPFFYSDNDIFTIHGYTEDYIMQAFAKFPNLKAFL